MDGWMDGIWSVVTHRAFNFVASASDFFFQWPALDLIMY